MRKPYEYILFALYAAFMVGLSWAVTWAQSPSPAQQYQNLIHQQDAGQQQTPAPFYNRPASTPDIPYNNGYQVGPPIDLRSGLSQQPATQGLPGPSQPVPSYGLHPSGPWNNGR
jgi:hypothetical protein